jgi:DNA polymerase I-like protein with 3'-5' exonuclease and polymerase domains
VHDEVMLEGPRETAAEAKARVVAAMENPWAVLRSHWAAGDDPWPSTDNAWAWARGREFGGRPLRVELAVDCKAADTWYDAK